MIELPEFGELHFEEKDFADTPPVALDGVAMSATIPEKWERLLRHNPKARELWDTNHYGDASRHAYALMGLAGRLGLTKEEAAAVHVAHYDRLGRKKDGIRKASLTLRAWEKGRQEAEQYEAGAGNGRPEEQEPGEPGSDQSVAPSGQEGESTAGRGRSDCMIPLAAYLRRKRDTPSHTVPDFGWGPGGVLVLAAMGGLGKTLLLQSMGLDLATDSPTLNAFSAARDQRVGLFLLEDPDHENAKRLRSILSSRDDESARLWIFDRERESLTLGERGGWPNKRGFALLDQALGDLKLSILLFDPLVNLHDAEENSNTEMLRWLKPLRDLCRKHGAAVGISHHTTWGSQGQQHERGATAIRNWADTVLLLRDVQGERGTNERRRLSVTKMNFGRPFDPMIATIDPATLRVTLDTEGATLCTVEDMLHLIREELEGSWEGKVTDFYAKAASHFGASVTTIRNTFADLKKQEGAALKNLGKGKGFTLHEVST